MKYGRCGESSLLQTEREITQLSLWNFTSAQHPALPFLSPCLCLCALKSSSHNGREGRGEGESDLRAAATIG